MTEKTPGQVSWTARNMALAGPSDQPGDVAAELGHAWDYLDPGQQEAEEAGAQAVLDNRSPWGDADAVSKPVSGHMMVMRGTVALRDAEIELLNARIAELAEALGEAAGHVEPLDQNSELAVGRWLELARRHRGPRRESAGTG